jgi:uncharacterized protein YfaS (alpha-2-macroglobulin family)
MSQEDPSTRIAQLPEMGWASQNASAYQYLDIRDDRIHYFTTVGGSVQSYYYVARAVSKGNFRMGPASADAMYNGEYHSVSGAGSIQVLDKIGQEPLGRIGDAIEESRKDSLNN